MKIARIRNASLVETYAIVSEDGKRLITRLEIQDQTGIPIPFSIKEFMFKGWLDEVKQYQGKLEYVHKVEELELLAPLPNPPKIICLAFNYYDHAKDAGLTPSDEPVIFMKPRTTLNSPYSNIVCPSFVKRLDYEAEIAAIIGKDTKKASIDQSVDSIFGYMILHDVSARDIQFKDKQFTRGKSIDTFAPCGPWITTKDEISDPQNLEIITKVNGEVRQSSNTADMLFGVAELVSYISRHFTLEPGDLIATGTPEGVIQGRRDGRWLTAGDEVVVEVGALGRLVNRIV